MDQTCGISLLTTNQAGVSVGLFTKHMFLKECPTFQTAAGFYRGQYMKINMQAFESCVR